jgi:subfamily B ATP-binding cassette protein MsbA
MVTQESVLFNDSVYNNILMGKPDATREEVIAAAKIANADDLSQPF